MFILEYIINISILALIVYLLRNYQIREYNDDDSKNAYYFLSGILANEFNIILDFQNQDSDLLDINNHYNKDDGGCFWVVEKIDNNQIIGTVAIRKLKNYTSATTNDNNDTIAELKRMFLSKRYRGLGVGQQMLDTALAYAKKRGYSKIFLYSLKELEDSRKLYLKNGFVDISRYNKDPRANVFMEKKL